MATVTTPVLAWTASLIGTATGITQSTSLTTTVNLTQGWEIAIPIKVQFSSVSADVVVNAYPSGDGGATYDSNPQFTLGVARISGGGARQSTIKLPVGQYALQIVSPGPSSQSFQVLTAVVLTAIVNN